jgi:dTDP-4-dehydrorhamnose reductase
VEAIRIDLKEPHGPEILLQELWQRYKIPVAITEVHLHCSREEQVRWLQHMNDVALKLKDSIDIRAVTAWSLLGSFGWNKLLTDINCDYETGAFDISAGYARPTALATRIKELSASEITSPHFLPQDGWWKQDSRFYNTQTKNTMTTSMQSRRPLIIIGKTGVLGRAFATACRQRNINHLLLGRNDVDICNSASIEKMIKDYDPWCIINAAGYLNVDAAEQEKDECYKINTLGPQKLGILSELHHIKLVCFSSDLVFDGTKDSAYVESDACNALNIYGSSKVFAENFLANVNPSSLVIRTSAFFTAWDNNTSFVSRVLQHLQNNMPISVFEDNIVSPTYVPHLVNASLDLLMDDCNGIWHLANKGSLSWYRFAQDVATRAGLDESLLVPVSAKNSPARRPAYSVLISEKYNLMPTLEEGLQHYFIQHEALVLNNAW